MGDGQWLVHNADCSKLIGRYGGSGGGHHIFSKAAFKGEPNYDPNKALALSNEWMEAMGWDHKAMTAKQKELFDALAGSGRPNTLNEHTQIAVEALKAGGVPEDLARQMVAAALNDLRNAGVRSPTRIPWH